MAKKEVKTDYWVYSLLKSANIKATPQGSDIEEINEALKTASKKGTGNIGFPEFIAIVKDFLIVIEDKSDLSKHCKLDSNSCIDLDNTKSVTDFAVNGAIHYAKHLAQNTSYKKIIAIGVSGDERHHKISPYFINERGILDKKLNDLETFTLLNESNIESYYLQEILGIKPKEETTDEEVKQDAECLHEYLRNYGAIKDADKPLIVSGILLALDEMKENNLNLEYLNNDEDITDGEKLYELIEKNLKRARLSPETKRDKVLSQFSVIKDTKKINELCEILNKDGTKINSTPLKYYSRFVKEKIYDNIQNIKNSEDYLGRFYSEFMRFSGGDAQSLGIVLTPRHITELFCELADLKPNDIILDPCCGTGGFLVSAMNDMISKTDDIKQKNNIRQNQLFGFELQPFMFAVATTNMVLRGDGKSNLNNEDFLKQNPKQLQTDCQATVGFMNPPYSQGKVDKNLTEISFTEHLCDSILKGGKVVVIIPQSAVTGKTKEEKATKESILKKHTLEGVITLNKNTFYRVGTNTCIAIFTAGIPHDYKNKICKFINFENDGWEVQKHKGLIENKIKSKDRKEHLLKVWNDEIDAETKFCVKTTIEPDDEWLHNFYYFNDELPKQEDFEKTMADYLTFEFNMIMQNKDYIFKFEKREDIFKNKLNLNDIEWKEFKISEIFEVSGTITTHPSQLKPNGKTPRITCASTNNALDDTYANSPTEKGKVLTIDSATVGYVSYQENDFIATDHVEKIWIKNNKAMNRYIGLFLKQCIDNAVLLKYGYGYKFSQTRIKKQIVNLPIDSKGEPHWEFMENFMREVEYKKLNLYLDYIKKSKPNL
ncbi:N-6 DNA methylase [Brachyspira sp.]|uniref:N-6 DNA methylase n=1 Tax=Brachyspira sp. TaxID=1977261 RepID=UPI003D7CF709